MSTGTKQPPMMPPMHPPPQPPSSLELSEAAGPAAAGGVEASDGAALSEGVEVSESGGDGDGGGGDGGDDGAAPSEGVEVSVLGSTPQSCDVGSSPPETNPPVMSPLHDEWETSVPYAQKKPPVYVPVGSTNLKHLDGLEAWLGSSLQAQPPSLIRL